MQASDTKKSLFAALAKFNGLVGKINKDANNPFFKSKYATLSNILDAIQAPMAECQIGFTQIPESDDTLTTIIFHTESGEFIQGSYSIHPVKTDPQGIGSAITYARRYALGAMLGLNIDEDDDGNAASNKKQQPTKEQPKNGSLTAQEFDEWKAAVDNASSIDELAKMYDANKPTIESYPAIKKLFTVRKAELQLNTVKQTA